MKKTTLKNIMTAGSLLVILMFAATLAYFSSNDFVTNSFTVGSVKLLLKEEAYDRNSQKTLAYAQKIPKDPRIVNDGLNEEIVFLKVIVPLRNVSLIESKNGMETPVSYNNSEIFNFYGTSTKNPETYDTSNNSLFQYNTGTDDKGWVMLTSHDGETYPKVANQQKIYLFGYKSKLAVSGENASTITLFDYIQLKNLLEENKQTGTLTANSQLIQVYAYGIQAKELIQDLDAASDKQATLEAIFTEYFD